MSTVVHIRDVPDEVHAALVAAAGSAGLSLTKYMLRELEHIAGREQSIARNIAIVRSTQSTVGGRLGTASILAELDQGRDE